MWPSTLLSRDPMTAFAVALEGPPAHCSLPALRLSHSALDRRRRARDGNSIIHCHGAKSIPGGGKMRDGTLGAGLSCLALTLVADAWVPWARWPFKSRTRPWLMVQRSYPRDTRLASFHRWSISGPVLPSRHSTRFAQEPGSCHSEAKASIPIPAGILGGRQLPRRSESGRLDSLGISFSPRVGGG